MDKLDLVIHRVKVKIGVGLGWRWCDLIGVTHGHNMINLKCSLNTLLDVMDVEPSYFKY
jgi:hypothetical protein